MIDDEFDHYDDVTQRETANLHILEAANKILGILV